MPVNLALVQAEDAEDSSRLAYERIPVRNVWFLFLYAYDLAQFRGRFNAEIEDSPDIKSLIGRLLCHAVETRLRRNLSFAYRRREEILKRVRGRIDILRTETGGLIRRGEIACRFDELTIDTPRNRLVWAALTSLSVVLSERDLAQRSRLLAGALRRAGVSGIRPSRAELASDQLGRHESGDRLMVSLARAVFEIVLPSETEGVRSLLESNRDDTKFRKLFERAVGNFLSVELPREDGWRVYPGRQLKWPVGSKTSAIDSYLPIMITDIVVENEEDDRRLVIDTKFTEVLAKSQYNAGQRFKSPHIYQLYAYLRSQEDPGDPRSLCSEGLLLYPAVGATVDECAEIQGHVIRFATVDLGKPTNAVADRLRQLPLERGFGTVGNGLSRAK